MRLRLFTCITHYLVFFVNSKYLTWISRTRKVVFALSCLEGATLLIIYHNRRLRLEISYAPFAHSQNRIHTNYYISVLYYFGSLQIKTLAVPVLVATSAVVSIRPEVNNFTSALKWLETLSLRSDLYSIKSSTHERSSPISSSCIAHVPQFRPCANLVFEGLPR